MTTLSGIITPSNVLTATNTATLTNKTWNSVAIGAAFGGTGATTLTAENVILGDGTSAVKFVAPGTTGNVLTSDGTTWTSAAAGGAWTFLSSVTASTSATVDVETTFSSTFDTYMLVGDSIIPGTNAEDLLCRFKVGGSYDTGSNYYYHISVPTNAGTFAGATGNGTTSIKILDQMRTAAGLSGNFVMFISNPSTTALFKYIHWRGVGPQAASGSNILQEVGGAAMNSSTAALTGVRFLANSGNIASGTFRLYGLTNS